MASAKNWVFSRVRIERFGDAELGLDAVHCMFKHVPLQLGNVFVKAVGSRYDTRNRWDKSVKA